MSVAETVIRTLVGPTLAMLAVFFVIAFMAAVHPPEPSEGSVKPGRVR